MQAVGDPENKVVCFAVCGTAEILVPPRWVCGRTVLHIDIYITTTFGSTIRVEDNRNPPSPPRLAKCTLRRSDVLAADGNQGRPRGRHAGHTPSFGVKVGGLLVRAMTRNNVKANITTISLMINL